MISRFKQRGMLLNPFRFGASAGGDPHWDKVALLCPFTDDLLDYSPTPKVVTAYGDAHISTAQAKYGAGSLFLDGIGDYVSVAHDLQLNMTGTDFTFEGLLYWPTGASEGQIFNKDGVSGVSYPQYELQISGGVMRVFIGNGAGVSPSGVSVVASVSAPRDRWFEWAIEKYAGNIHLYQEGAHVGSTSIAWMYDGGKPLLIGAQAPGVSFFNGYAQQLRLTRVARFMGHAYVPAPGPFPIG